MTSWQIFAHLVPFWAGGPTTPVYVREAAAPPLWARAAQLIERASGPMPLILGAVMVAAVLWAPWSVMAALLTLTVMLGPSSSNTNLLPISAVALLTWTNWKPPMSYPELSCSIRRKFGKEENMQASSPFAFAPFTTTTESCSIPGWLS